MPKIMTLQQFKASDSGNFSQYVEYLKTHIENQLIEISPHENTRTLQDMTAYIHALTQIAATYLDEISDGAYIKP